MNNNKYLIHHCHQKTIEVLFCKTEHGDWERIEHFHQPELEALSVDVLLSAQHVFLLSLTPPKNYEKYGKPLLFNLVESNIIGAIDDIELFVVKKSKKKVIVAVINKTVWNTLIDQLHSHGWTLGNVWIDALCLPVEKNTASLFALDNNTVLWRNNNDDIFSGTHSVLQDTPEYKTTPSHWLTEEPQRLSDKTTHNQLFSYIEQASHNLNPQQNTQDDSKSIKSIIVLALSALFLWTIYLYVSNQSHKNNADAYYQASKELFTDIFPDAKKIPSRSYITQRLERLINDKKAADNSSWKRLLKILADNINSHVTVNSVSYSAAPEYIRVSITSTQKTALSQFKNSIQKYATLKQLSTNTEDNHIVVTWEIRL